MIIPDINILIYAVNKDYSHHVEARKWLEDAMSGAEPVGLAWIVILGFIRVVTSDRILDRPLDMHTAFSLVDGWLVRKNVRIIEPAVQHWSLVKELLFPLSTAGNLTSDAHLAALAIEHGGCLCSTDNDFGRFKGLRWRNPLADDGSRSLDGARGMRKKK